MTWAEFKRKWHRYTGKESSAYQEHFNDLCRLLEQPTPAEADPSGNDFFCFQKRVVKDAELSALRETSEEAEADERGFADVWKKGCFGWEYKGKKKNLDEAYKQLLRYREALLNPPLLVVCDFERYVIKTNFNGTVQEKHEFINDQIDRPENLRILRSLFENPDFLKPQRTTAQVTEVLAGQIAEVARSLQSRESVELADAKNREEVNVAQKKNLRIARFLNRIIFCFFAEDTGLLPESIFADVCKAGLDDPKHFAERLEALFRVMAKGGSFGVQKIRHFNGHLFEEATVFELTEGEIRKLADASEADWQFIEPSIMGTLFERAIDEKQRAQLGAHYTSRADIETLVEPVLTAPFRREWGKLKGELVPAYIKGQGTKEHREKLAKFLKKLSSVTVLDPACGSGNFLYVSLQLLLGLEKEIITFATQLGFSFRPQVDVKQLKAIEINPYAFELAQVSVQIGYLQWRRDNGFDNDRSPVLQVLDGFENKDALLNQTFRKKPKSLKEAQAEEHAGDDTVKVYTERAWPECDVIVGNPPFLGSQLMRGELGDDYVDELRRTYGNRIPGQSDLCCYWFEKARDQIDGGKCKRAGLLATQGIRGGANREVLKRINKTGDIFFAESDRDWILAGANVHVSMVGFDDGKETQRVLDSKPVNVITSNLSGSLDLTDAAGLSANKSICFQGPVKVGSFEILENDAVELLKSPNPNGLPSSDVLSRWVNGNGVTKREPPFWIIDFGALKVDEAGKYAAAFHHVETMVKVERLANRDKQRSTFWWRLGRSGGDWKTCSRGLPRTIFTPRVSKFRLFVWVEGVVLPDSAVVGFARSDDYTFGLLHSRFHEVWSLKQGTRLETRPRYTPTTCFETFPFPFVDDLQAPLSAFAPAPSKPPSHPDLTPEQAYADAAHFYSAKEDAPLYGGSSRREEAHSSRSQPSTLNTQPAYQSFATSAATKEEHRAAIAAAAKELNDLRERWLNPPEWTVEKILEFPGSVNGPWARYIDPSTIREVGRDAAPRRPPSELDPVSDVSAKRPYLVGLVRYPRLEPRDAECAAKLKKRTLTNLYNERPAWLDHAHKKLDTAVAAAYGWPADLTDEQILERLLALNLERAAEEETAAKVKKPQKSRQKRTDEML